MPKKIIILLLTFCFLTPPFAFASKEPIAYPGLPSIVESEAYAKFVKRPLSDRSRLMYLMDRFAETDVEILYDGFFFKTLFASQVTRWFFARNYANETTKEWLMRWCNTSVIKNELIWVRLPDQSMRLSRDVLFAELRALKEVVQKNDPPFPKANKPFAS